MNDPVTRIHKMVQQADLNTGGRKMKLMQDDKGNTSFARMSSAGCLVVAAAISFMLLGKDGVIDYNELWLVAIWVLAGVASKQVGKFLEKMEPPKA
jgi:hypothetical protein